MSLACACLALLFGASGAFFVGYGSTLRDADHLRRERLGLHRRCSPCRSPLVRILHPLLWLFKPLAKRVYSNARFDSAAKRLLSAGLEEEMTPEEFLAYKMVMPIVSALGLHLVPGLHLGLLAVFAALSTFFPDLWLRGRKSLRQQAILSRLAFTVDLLTLSVEAGLDFGQALAEVAVKLGEGPLAEEIQKALKQMRLGATRSQALTDLAQRVELPELASFVAVLIQADRLGVSIGKALRSQSDRLRNRRFHRAEEMGAAAAQKILVPLILFILPAVVLIIFGAVGLSLLGG